MQRIRIFAIGDEELHMPITSCDTFAEALFRAEGLIDYTPTHHVIRCYIGHEVIMEMARGVFQPSLFYWEELQKWEQ